MRPSNFASGDASFRGYRGRAAKLVAENADLVQGDIDAMLAIFDTERSKLVAALIVTTDNDSASYPMHKLGALKSMIDATSTKLRYALTDVIDRGVARSYEDGTKLTTNALGANPMLRVAAREPLNVLRQSGAESMRSVADTFRTTATKIVARGVVGQANPQAMIKDIAEILRTTQGKTDATRFGTAVTRAETTFRTEMHAAFSIGNHVAQLGMFGRIKEATITPTYVGDTGELAPGIYKTWLSMRDDKVRETHVEADDAYSEGGDPGPIPFGEPFVVDGEELDYPGDPNGSPGNVINCRCVSMPYDPGWFDQGAQESARRESFDAKDMTERLRAYAYACELTLSAEERSTLRANALLEDPFEIREAMTSSESTRRRVPEILRYSNAREFADGVETPRSAYAYAQFLRESGAREEPKEATLMVDLSNTIIGTAIRRFGFSINVNFLAEDGLEDDPHITVKYGVSEEGLAEILAQMKPIMVSFDQTAHFSAPNYDVLYVTVYAPGLVALHGMLPGRPDDHATYTPHATIGYLKCGKALNYDGILGPFLGRQIVVSELVLSRADRSRVTFTLGGVGLRESSGDDGAGHWVTLEDGRHVLLDGPKEDSQSSGPRSGSAAKVAGDPNGASTTGSGKPWDATKRSEEVMATLHKASQDLRAQAELKMTKLEDQSKLYDKIYNEYINHFSDTVPTRLIDVAAKYGVTIDNSASGLRHLMYANEEEKAALVADMQTQMRATFNLPEGVKGNLTARYDGASSVPGNRTMAQKSVAPAIAQLNAWSNATYKLPESFAQVHWVLDPNLDRSYHNADGVTMAQGADARTFIHETGHFLENVVPGLHDKVVSFINHRTQGENAVSIASVSPDLGYDAKEMTHPDHFPDAYDGKIYADKYGTITASEIIAMGLQHMYLTPGKFASEDPEYFRFMINALQPEAKV